MRPDPPGLPSFQEFETPGPLLFLPLLLIQGGGMDLSRVGEKLLSSVRSARSLGLLPSQSERPEVPARAAAAAAAARALAGIPPHQRISLPSSSGELLSIYGSGIQGQTLGELEEDFYEEDFDPFRYILENVPSEENDAIYFDKQSTLRLAQLDQMAERLSRHVMEHHEEMDMLTCYWENSSIIKQGCPTVDSKEVQDLLLEYGLENVTETLVEGLSRVKRCTDEGRVLMSLDLQVLINGLQHIISMNVKPKLQIVETYIYQGLLSP